MEEIHVNTVCENHYYIDQCGIKTLQSGSFGYILISIHHVVETPGRSLNLNSSYEAA